MSTIAARLRLAGILAAVAVAGLPAASPGQMATLRPPVVEGAEKVRIEHITMHSAEIAGNLLGTSPERHVFIVLPPSYERDPARRSPVVYALHGYSIGAEQWLSELHMPQTAEGAFASGVPEMILVFPSSRNEHNGAFYANSPTTGNFENWIADELIAYVDANYRTLAQPASRGLTGHSMGGYGASRIGIRRAERYGALYLMSPCCQSALGSRGLSAEQVGVIEALPSVAAAAELPFASRGPLAIASAFSPNPKNPPLYVGNKDGLVGDTRKMHAALLAYDIPNTLAVYDGDHTNRLGFRMQDHVLPFFGKTLAFEKSE